MLLAPRDDDRLEARELARPGARLGQRVVVKAITGSTNDDAWALIEAGAGHGVVVVANQQERGRGRKGRPWRSPAGAGLYFSVVLCQRLPPSPGLVTLAAGVAVARAVQAVAGLPARIKWPNDVRVGGKKLCGILAEARGQAGLEAVVLGVGVNVNLAPDDLPEELRAIATSLRAETGKTFPRQQVFAAILAELERLLDLAAGPGPERVIAEWTELAEALGSRVRVEGADGVFVGTAVGVRQDGALLVRDDRDRSERAVVAGDVFLTADERG